MVWVARPATIEELEVEVPRDLTQEELEIACLPLMRETATTLEDAQGKVATLESQVRTKEEEVIRLEGEMSRRSTRGRELIRELDQAKRQLAALEEELNIALEEKAELLVALEESQQELKVTRVKLREQKEETHVAKEDALEQRWSTFLGRSQLEVCERGTRNRLGKCREAIEEAFGPEIRARFKHCVRSNQAFPEVKEIERKQELPAYGVWIDQDNRITRDWYVLFCDPNLPEARSSIADIRPIEPIETIKAIEAADDLDLLSTRKPDALDKTEDFINDADEEELLDGEFEDLLDDAIRTRKSKADD